VGKALKYPVSADVMARIAAAAEDSLAAILARSRLGMAIAAIIRIIATTINNSINEKPFVEDTRMFGLMLRSPLNNGTLRAILA